MEIGEVQQGFRKGRRMTDAMFVLRQVVEKRLEVQGEMALGFVEKDGDGATEMDGSTGSRCQVGGKNVQGKQGKRFGWSWDV